VLRNAGLPVVELAGWKQRGGELVDVDAVVWHHDGSPPGASPSVPKYMAGQIDQNKAGAQCWVGLDGTWHLVAAGKVFHTGEVLTGKHGNSRSLGIETDHTTGEPWSGVKLLASLREGTAAILRHIGADEQAIEFHKTICSPVGRKQDPDGLDLHTERAAVAALLGGDDLTNEQAEQLATVNHFVRVIWPNQIEPMLNQIKQHLDVLMLGVPGMDIPPTPRLIQELAEKHGIDV
jgi:hypothetical protein